MFQVQNGQTATLQLISPHLLHQQVGTNHSGYGTILEKILSILLHKYPVHFISAWVFGVVSIVHGKCDQVQLLETYQNNMRKDVPYVMES